MAEKEKIQFFRLNLRNLGPNLIFVPDALNHGTIQPARGTTYEQYKKALENTQNLWEPAK